MEEQREEAFNRLRKQTERFEYTMRRLSEITKRAASDEGVETGVLSYALHHAGVRAYRWKIDVLDWQPREQVSGFTDLFTDLEATRGKIRFAETVLGNASVLAGVGTTSVQASAPEGNVALKEQPQVNGTVHNLQLSETAAHFLRFTAELADAFAANFGEPVKP